MNLSIFQVDAFTDRLFSGNPAAVCPLDEWLPDELLQSIAEENNLAETAFFVKEGETYHIRWFTPTTEVKLCGHATLASAYVLFDCLMVAENPIHFSSRSGSLYVSKNGDGSMTMDFPQSEVVPCSTPQALWESLGAHPIACFKGEDYVAILDCEDTLVNIQPDLRQMATLRARGISVTAKGDHCDFVSRFFAPQSGIDEDPVTGSAFCATAPYWAKKLKKNTLTAIQRSKREGHVLCHVTEDRVQLTGNAVLFLRGQIETSGQKKFLMKPKVLILCTGNSCRSHMAEGILRRAAGDIFEIHSAGSNPAGYVHPKAIAVMHEIGIDISHHSSKSLDTFLEAGIDTIITVCDNANEACPVFPGKVNRYHWSFEDPAHAQGSDEEVLKEFRSIRDQIKLVFEAFVSGYRQSHFEDD